MPPHPPARGALTAEEEVRLLSVYQTERQDDQVALQVAFAITVGALTYVLVAGAYLIDHCTKGACDAGPPAFLRYCTPTVAIAFIGFLILNVGATRMRSVHLQRLEALLAINLPAPPDHPAGMPVPRPYNSPHLHTDYGLVYRPDFKPSRNLAGKQRIRRVYATISIVSYGVILVALVAFTMLALWSGPWDGLKITFAVIYGLVELVFLTGMLGTLTHSAFKPDKA